jgi:hypothetical protein
MSVHIRNQNRRGHGENQHRRTYASIESELSINRTGFSWLPPYFYPNASRLVLIYICHGQHVLLFLDQTQSCPYTSHFIAENRPEWHTSLELVCVPFQ